MDISRFLKDIEFVNGIPMEDIPELDLYMDQVIQLFEGKLSPLKRNEDEKILTKTMINNYAKGKLLLPIKNKKYSKEHLILMALIYNLKGGLSINDIKLSFNSILENFEEDNSYPLRDIYKCFLDISKEDTIEFRQSLNEKDRIVEEMVTGNLDKHDEFEKKFLLLCSLINMSNMYRRAGEKLVDEFFTRVEGE